MVMVLTTARRKTNYSRNISVASGKFSEKQIGAVCTLAVLVLVYSFGTVNWLRK